jgi:hypothetical protein
MKRSITRWTMAVATAGVLSLPVSSFARTQDPQPQPQQQQPPAQPQPQQPQPEPQPSPTPAPQQQTPAPQPSAAAMQPQTEQALTPQDHLKKAQEAAKDIDASSIPSKNRSALVDMKKHLANLDKIASSSGAAPAETAAKGAESSKKESINWGTEVGAIDKAITEMVGTETSTPSAPTPTGTSGKADAVDAATRAKLMDVRTHITAYAAAMAGGSTPKTEAAPPKTEAAARPEPSMTPAPTQSPAPEASPAQNPPAQSPSPSPAQPDPKAAQPAQPPAAQPSPANQPPAAQSQPQQQVGTDAAHRHLLTARETLAQLTQLPAATQLSGEARNQVSQLITNFNELITTQSNWKSSYDKVSANLTTLLGPDNSDNEAAGGAPNPNAGATPAPNPGATPTPNAGATATPGAVGTTGTATMELDPSIRAKLVEFRKSLNDFRKAVGPAGQ